MIIDPPLSASFIIIFSPADNDLIEFLSCFVRLSFASPPLSFNECFRLNLRIHLGLVFDSLAVQNYLYFFPNICYYFHSYENVLPVNFAKSSVICFNGNWCEIYAFS